MNGNWELKAFSFAVKICNPEAEKIGKQMKPPMCGRDHFIQIPGRKDHLLECVTALSRDLSLSPVYRGWATVAGEIIRENLWRENIRVRFCDSAEGRSPSKSSELPSLHSLLSRFGLAKGRSDLAPYFLGSVVDVWDQGGHRFVVIFAEFHIEESAVVIAEAVENLAKDGARFFGTEGISADQPVTCKEVNQWKALDPSPQFGAIHGLCRKGTSVRIHGLDDMQLMEITSTAIQTL